MAFDFKKHLAGLSERELGRRIEVASKPVAASVAFRSSTATDFTSRDVYQFSKHPKVIRAAQKALESSGFSTNASRFSTGTDAQHVRLESRLSEFMGTGSSLLFNTRNQAVLSLVSCLANERDAFVVSSNVRAPFVDAAYLVDCDCAVFNPDAPESLHVVLQGMSNKVNKFIVIDAISSTSGKTREFQPLLEIAAQHDADVILDESLSFGILGARGAGAFDVSPELTRRVLCSLVDFSMLLGLKGAAISGAPELVSLILARSGALEHETPLSLPAVAALLRSIDLLELAAGSRKQLLELGEVLVEGLRSEGWDTIALPAIPVLSLCFDSFRFAREFHRGLFECGVLGEVISGGSERRGEVSLSVFLTVGHKQKDIQKALEAFSTVRKRLLT